jgi:hypothetical protein
MDDIEHMSRTGVDARLRNAVVGLYTAARLWLDVNKDAIGEKWYKKIDRELRKVEGSSHGGQDYDCAKAMSLALWTLNVLATLGATAHIGQQGLRVIKVPEHLDRATTLLLFVAIYDVYKAAQGCG